MDMPLRRRADMRIRRCVGMSLGDIPLQGFVVCVNFVYYDIIYLAVGLFLSMYRWRIVDYWFSHCGVKAIERAKRLDLYLMSERKTIYENNNGEETGTIGSLIETERARIKETEKERRKGNVGNPPLSRMSNNPDTN